MAISEKDLAWMILVWWEDEQYAESYPGCNKYDVDSDVPDFVKEAQKIEQEVNNG